MTESMMTMSSLPAAPATAAQALDRLQEWGRAGLLRRLDQALAALVLQLDPGAEPALLFAVALLSQLEGRGHTCLPVDALPQAPAGLLGWTDAEQSSQASWWTALGQGDAETWLALIRQSRLVRVVDQAAVAVDQGQPLVLWLPTPSPASARLYLRRYWLHERQVVEAVRARSSAGLEVDEAQAARWLDRLFPGRADGAPDSPDWQKLACALALRGRLTVITGGPGTGKTYTAARLLALLLATASQPDQLRIGLAAPTGKAAARLKQSIDQALAGLAATVVAELDLPGLVARLGPARTLHSLLGARPDTRAFRHDAQHPLPLDILIVDEASMIHLEMMAALLAALPDRARLVLLGDKDQLASVEAGAVLGDLCQDVEAGRYDQGTAAYAHRVAGVVLPLPMRLSAGTSPTALAQRTVMLRESRRFGGPIGQLALAVNRGDVTAASRCLHGSREGDELWARTGGPAAQIAELALQGRPGAEQGYRAYAQLLRSRPETPDAHGRWVREVLAAYERFRILCAVRDGEWGAAGVNRAVQARLAEAGWLKPTGEWYAGRPVMITRNDPHLGIFNGDIGLALPGPALAEAGGTPLRTLRVWFQDGERLRSVSAARLAHVETAFAMTVHKSQGSEFEHTLLVLPAQAEAVLSRELVYTGITRAKRAFSLLAARDGVFEEAVGRPTRRASGLADQLSS